MTAYHWLLLFHLLGAFCFVAGAVVAGTLQLAAIRRERPSEVALLLRLTRTGVALVGIGSLATLGFGIALAEHLGYGLSPAWIQAAIALLARDPRPPGAKALRGRDGLRVRVGEYRIIYTVQDDVLLVVVVTLGHRRDVYDR